MVAAGYDPARAEGFHQELFFGPMPRPSDHSRNARRMLADLTQYLAVLQDGVRKHFPEQGRAWMESAVVGLENALEELRVTQSDLEEARDEADLQRQRYQDLFQFAPDGYLVTDPHGSIRDANDAAHLMFQIRSRFALGKPLIVFIEREDHDNLFRALSDLKHGQPIVQGTLRIRGRRQEEIIVQFRAAPEPGFGGAITGIRWALRNITDQVHAQDQFARNREQLRALAAELAQAEQRKRRRIAEGIHDHAIQGLALAKMTLSSVHGNLSPRHAGAISQTIDLMGQVTADLRGLIFDLSPPVLYELGLGPAVEWLVERLSKQHRLPIELRNTLEPNEMTVELRIPLFGAIRELLINVVKHAKATRTAISLKRTNHHVQVHVLDNGRGMSVLPQPGNHHGFGLFNLSNRIELMGGTFRIRSSPGRGTCTSLPCRSDPLFPAPAISEARCCAPMQTTAPSARPPAAGAKPSIGSMKPGTMARPRRPGPRKRRPA